jgi:hypothetical protein
MKQIALRLSDELAAAIDSRRGQVPRERWIRERLAEVVVVRAVASPVEQADRSVVAPVRSVSPAMERMREIERRRGR